MFNLTKSARAVAAAAGAVALCTSIALAQSDVQVTLNGAPLNLNPAPQERSGRVFVPLRGVFEQLGASVVYDGGTINAQGRGHHSVSLHIGSTQATVDGQQQTIDVAPFIIGASTYVPLRFVSQALGATVNYDASNRVVALSEGPQQTAGGPPPPEHTALTLSVVRPNRGEVVTARRPTIEADFANGRVNRTRCASSSTGSTSPIKPRVRRAASSSRRRPICRRGATKSASTGKIRTARRSMLSGRSSRVERSVTARPALVVRPVLATGRTILFRCRRSRWNCG